MRRFTRLTAAALTVVAAATLAAPAARAQHDHHGDEHADEHVMESMGGDRMDVRHLALTPARPATAADSARAAAVLAELRRAIAPYRDYRAALADGFRPFLPNVPQRVYHFTSYRRAVGEALRFDPARPSSLLYEKTPDGYRLVGAMYAAPARLTPEELDARVPLGIARWHRHVNLCLPPRGERDRWTERRDGHLLFGPQGSIATRDECDAAGGRFLPQLFGWMVHVDAFAEDPNDIWGSEHRH